MLIKELTIYSSTLSKQSNFYSNVLGLKVLSTNKKSVSFKLGASKLTFQHDDEATPYHFAINIPANKVIEALAWLKERVEILKDGEHEIQDFSNWNAKAIYFYDNDRNIVELIARKNLNNDSNQKFDTNCLLEISEIGLPTLDIEKEFNLLNKATEIEIFDGNFERFCAIGDEHGLFICINKNAKKWFPTNDEAFSSDFDLLMTEKGKTFRVKYLEQRLSIE